MAAFRSLSFMVIAGMFLHCIWTLWQTLQNNPVWRAKLGTANARPATSRSIKTTSTLDSLYPVAGHVQKDTACLQQKADT